MRFHGKGTERFVLQQRSETYGTPVSFQIMRRMQNNEMPLTTAQALPPLEGTKLGQVAVSVTNTAPMMTAFPAGKESARSRTTCLWIVHFQFVPFQFMFSSRLYTPFPQKCERGRGHKSEKVTLHSNLTVQTYACKMTVHSVVLTLVASALLALRVKSMAPSL